MEEYHKAIISLGLFGCASSTTRMTESRTTVTEYNQGSSGMQGNEGNFPGGGSGKEEQKNGRAQTVVEKTEIKKEKSQGASRGVLGTTLNFVGQVLAFPSKIIAGAIEFIF